jgi:hypothetical protein
MDNLDSLDFGSRNLSSNLGSIFIFFLITVTGLLLILIFRLSTKCCKCCICCGKAHKKLADFFLWNWCIRLVFEATMEFTFACYLNIRFFDSWEETPWGGKVDYVLAIFFAVLVILAPFAIMYFYCKNLDKL